MIDSYLIQLARQATINAADALRPMLGDAGVISSEAKDIKTVADHRADQAIRETLGSSFPIISEESEHPIHEHLPPEGCWIVDPLDGTLNFTRGFPIVGVSIAFWQDGEPKAGVVLDLFQKKTYHGIAGVGAWCNEQPIQVSEVSEIADAVIATGFPSGRRYDSESLLATVEKVKRYKKVRMLGCASMMITMVAAGIFDAYQEEDIYLWDVAGALALVKASGGTYRMSKGTGPWKFNVTATNGII